MAPNSNIRWPPSVLLATPPGGPQSQYWWPPEALILSRSVVQEHLVTSAGCGEPGRY
jgi:hypothetical protein